MCERRFEGLREYTPCERNSAKGLPQGRQRQVGQRDCLLEAGVSPGGREKLEIVGDQDNLALLHQDPEGTRKSHHKGPGILQQTLPGGGRQGEE